MRIGLTHNTLCHPRRRNSIVARYLNIQDALSLTCTCMHFQTINLNYFFKTLTDRDFNNPGRYRVPTSILTYDDNGSIVIDDESSGPDGRKCVPIDYYAAYIFSLTRSLEMEYYHLLNVKEVSQRCRNFIKHGSSGAGGGELLGAIFDLIAVEDKRIANAISNKRQNAMKTVVVRRGERFAEFRRKERRAGGAKPLSFIPLDMSFDSIAPGPMELKLEGANHEGFLGYVVNLVKLRPEHEHLRYTVLWALFKDLSVWKDKESVVECARRLGLKTTDIYHCSLDHICEPLVMIKGDFKGRTGDTKIELEIDTALQKYRKTKDHLTRVIREKSCRK